MASTEHCLMCFEALEAQLAGRKPLSLDRVRSLWAAYQASESSSPALTTAGTPSRRDPALRRVAGSDTPSSSSSASSSSSSIPSPASALTPATSTASLAPAGLVSTPLFVTWNSVADGDSSLRGCIGTFEAQPLSAGLAEYAVIAAMHDSRFPPVTKAELPGLQVSVTLLTDFEEVDDVYDWDLGKHGIRLSFHDRGRRYGSTYLPDVASEQGWTKDETLFSLIRKAGWVGSRPRWKELNLRVTRYQGSKASLQYPDYKKWRDWAASRQS